MRIPTIVLALNALSTCAWSAERPAENREAVERAVTFLAKDSLAWKENRKCASCHHAPMTIWALSEARDRGYIVDEKALGDLSTWVLATDDRARILNEPAQPAAPEPTPQIRKATNLNEGALLVSLGFVASSAKAGSAPEGLRKMFSNLLHSQGEDGSWRLPFEPRPIGSSPDTMTTLALLALSSPQAPDMGDAGKAAQAKGLRWLQDAKRDDDQQATALRLILWRRLKRPAKEWSPLVKELRVSQNADGGWGQTKDAKSDAFATGQALCALAEAGVKPGDSAVLKAQAFLVNTQRPDGAWEMTTRAILPSGKLSTNLEPIIHAGSAWAVIGLARSSPKLTTSARSARGEAAAGR